MRKLSIARSALDRGGLPELVVVVRKWVAKIAYPGPLPSPARPASAPKERATARRHSAETVNHAQALAWFENRRPIYDRLAAAVAPFVDRTGVFLDVGANIGYFTKVLGEVTDFRGTVHLFEPIPNLAALCRETLRDVPFKANVHEYGLSDQDATVEIFTAADGNLGWNTTVAERASKGMKSSQIQVRGFETSGIESTPSFIKIDVEGAEHRVLKGMLAALERWSPRPTILCEIGWGQRHPAWAQELEAVRSLEKLGYRAYDLDHEPVNIDDLQSTTDVIFLPEHLDLG